MSEQTIDRLQIEINAKSNSGAEGVDRLAQSIERLLSVTGKGVGELSGIAKSISEMKSALSGTASGANGLSRMAQSLQAIRNLNLTGVGKSLSTFSKQVSSLNGVGSGLNSIRDFSKGMTSMTKGIGKINSLDLTNTASQIKTLVTAIKPLTDEMLRGGTAANSYGTQLKEMAQAVKTMNSIKGSPQGLRASASSINNKLGLGLDFAKLASAVYAVGRVGTVVAGFISNINSYIENVNLFTVAMGDAADEGARFAQTLQDALGVDAGEAMRNMGLFKQLTSSFGATSEQSTILAKNMTQLGYDLSSFFNLSIDEAFTKLQSGIAGEIEPLRRIGIDLSEARLQQELYNLGIDQSVTKLTQADKALLRYIAVMRQTTNAQGDMARTIMTPANALRVLQAQLQVAGRAIGSIFIPALTAILPPAIAVVKVIGEAASAVARFFGFEMPTIDYSSLTDMPTIDITNNIDDITGSTDDYTDSVKEASKATKTLISGFDELNILKAPTEPSAGKDKDSGSGGANFGSVLGDIKLPEYDMLMGGVDSEIDEWVDKIKSAIDTATRVIDPFIPVLEGLAGGIAAGFAVVEVKKFWDVFKNLSGVSAISTGFSAFKDALKSSNTEMGKVKKFTTSAKTGLDAFRNSIPKVVKAAVGVAGVTTNFLMTSSAVEDATLKTEGWENKLLAMGGTFAITEGLLYAFCGPWGAVAGAVAGVIGAIKGFNDAQEQLQQEAFLADFFDGAGTEISEVSEQFKILSDTIVESNTPILEGRDAIDQSRTSIKDTRTEIEYLTTSVINGAKDIEDTMPQIQQQLDSFSTEIKTTLNQIYDNIYRALAGSVGDALAEMGVDIPQLTSLLADVQEETSTKIDEMKQDLQGLYDKLTKGEGDPTVIQQQISETMDELQGLVMTVDPVVEHFNTSISEIAIDNLDYENVDAFRDSIKEMGDSADAAKDSINDTFSTTMADLQTAIKDAEKVGNTYAESYFQSIYDSLDQARLTKIAEIEDAMRQTATKIQEDFYDQFNETAKNTAPTAWQRFLNSFIGGDENSLSATVKEKLLKSFDGVDSVFTETFAKYGEYSISGYTSGLIQKEYLARAQTESFGESVLDAFGNSIDSHSPSRAFEKYGKYSVQGYAQGLGDSLRAVDACKSLADDVMNTAESEFSRNKFKSIGEEAAKGITDGLKNMKFPDIAIPHFEIKYDTWGSDAKPWKDMGLQGRPEVDVNWYARGGIFDSPQIIGVGEQGREAVVPLEDNSPWINALAENVSAQITSDGSESDERLMAFINLCTDRVIDAIQENGNVLVQANLDGDDIAERVLVRKGGRR